MSSPRTAFSLLETILVILVVGLIAALGVPRMVEAADRRQLLAEARRLAADLNLARARAASTSTAYRIVFDLARGQYSTMPDDAARAALIQEGKTSIDGADSVTGQDVAIDLASTTRTQMLAVTQAATLERLELGGASEIVFNGFGAPNLGGFIVLSRGKYAISVTIEKDRGAVSIGPVTRTSIDPIVIDGGTSNPTPPANPTPPGDDSESDDRDDAGVLQINLLGGEGLSRLDTPAGDPIGGAQ
jgi:Tfp pilus assembly protein FimT